MRTLAALCVLAVALPCQGGACQTADFNYDGVVDGDDAQDFIACYFDDVNYGTCYPAREIFRGGGPVADEHDWFAFFAAYEFCLTH